MTDKTKSQTYNFLLENKSIEDILKQENIFVKEIKNKRHGGKTYRIDNNQQLNDDSLENNIKNLEPIGISLIDNQNMQKTNVDTWTKLTNYLNWATPNAEQLIQAQRTIQEKDKEIEQLKKQIEELKQSKQINVNFNKFKYNAVTIYDEKQRKKTRIEKIYEEILPINNKVYFITTIQHIDNSINEEVIYFQHLTNGDIQVVKQIKNYKNINDYKKDILLINDISTHNINNFQFVPIKDFLKQQQGFKLKPNKSEIVTWIITWLIIPLGVVAINLIHPPLLIISLVIGGIATALRGGVEFFSSTAKKVWSWFSNKYFKNKEQKEKLKKERESIIKNLTSNKTEIKLETQYDILKQELDNRKEKNPDQLISSETINQNSNIESVNNQNFDSSIRNTVNQQEQLPSTTSNHNWNKVKCLLTT
ncbi:hypothetical protein [Spiroplasma endosymbiont of Amphimallon solstitiale]|uniref:hypothetical protein n=1 Tax=Spiroplasma endosymbiont of Amphimallon solstitiale TaxID=3066288 RepID=UPI00313B1F71